MTPEARLGHYRGRPAKTPVSQAPSNFPDLWSKQTVVKEISRTESVVSESAVLVGVFLAERDRSLSHLDHELVPLEELEGLAEAAGTQVVGKLTQRRDPMRRPTWARERCKNWPPWPTPKWPT